MAREQPNGLEGLLVDPGAYLHTLFLAEDAFPMETITQDLLRIQHSGSDEEALGALKTLRDQKAKCLSNFANMASGYAGQRVSVIRGDWLYVEGWITHALHSLLWLAMAETEDFTLANGREHCLQEYCARFSAESLLETVLCSLDQSVQTNALIELCLRTISHLHSQFEGVEVEEERHLEALRDDPQRAIPWEPAPSLDLDGMQADLDRLVSALQDLPVHVGTVLIGSFGEEHKRDAFCDIDLNCVCSQLPTTEMRDQFIEALSPKDSDAFGCFVYLALNATGVHMSFVSQENQETCFRKRREVGSEFPFIEISNEKFATGSYYWSHGTILSDTDGVLDAYQAQGREVPGRYREVIRSKCALAWERFSETYQATRTHDRVTAMVALNYCTVAAIRWFLIENGIHIDPISPPKWVPIELSVLPPEVTSRMAGFDLVPPGASLPHDARFGQLTRLWDMYSLKQPG
ncbi:MAG: hypothetical protein HOC74_22115 [Gemmatimonadetes bacterium]|jgi:hypothetical protein|nr:hypothetical protein [Gemmatimonadota bacterium]